MSDMVKYQLVVGGGSGPSGEVGGELGPEPENLSYLLGLVHPLPGSVILGKPLEAWFVCL